MLPRAPSPLLTLSLSLSLNDPKSFRIFPELGVGVVLSRSLINLFLAGFQFVIAIDIRSLQRGRGRGWSVAAAAAAHIEQLRCHCVNLIPGHFKAAAPAPPLCCGQAVVAGRTGC